MKLRLKGFSDAAIVEGGPDAERRAQDELDREKRLRVAMNSGWPEIARADLEARPFSILEHTPSGDYYVVNHGLQDGDFGTADAFYVAKDGDPVFLKRPSSGPRSRAEFEQRQADREARRNQPKAKPSWMSE